MDKTIVPLGELNALFPTHRFYRRGEISVGDVINEVVKEMKKKESLQ